MRRWATSIALVVALVVVAGCSDDNPESGWEEVCGDAATRIAALPTTGSREQLGLAAAATAQNLRDLAVALEARPSGGDPVASANLRDGVRQVAVGYEDLGASIRGIGTGGRGRVERDVAALYVRIDASARTLGLADCRAVPLGSDRFTQLQARTRSQNLGLSPREVAQRACERLEVAYGITLIPIDEGAALTQLRRSRDVLVEIIRDTAGRTDATSVRLRSAARRGVARLTTADRAVSSGADPGTTTVRAIDDAGGLLNDAFRGSGVRCAALTVGTPGG